MGRNKISSESKMESFLLPTEEKNLLFEAAKAKGISKSALIRLACRSVAKHIIDVYQKAKEEAANEFIKAVAEKRKVNFSEIVKKHDDNAEKSLNKLLFEEIKEKDKKK